MNALIGDLASSSGPSVTTGVGSKFSSPPLGIDSPMKATLPPLDYDFSAIQKTEPTVTTTSVANVVPTLADNSSSGSSSSSTAILPSRSSAGELFSDAHRTFASPSPVQRPPEMIVVSMFWNDLPGLMIEGKRCVRLVDIHKQMLPAKDTGTCACVAV